MFCAKCGAPVLSQHKFCTGCGTGVAREAGIRESSPSVASQSAATSGPPIPIHSQHLRCLRCYNAGRTTILPSFSGTCPICGMEHSLRRRVREQAAHLGIPPMLFRVGFIVLGLAGAFGVHQVVSRSGEPRGTYICEGLGSFTFKGSFVTLYNSRVIDFKMNGDSVLLNTAADEWNAMLMYRDGRLYHPTVGDSLGTMRFQECKRE